jgi:alkanesulfonate monooxygenase SsuD/methylene tetrahydromethanopterin reductase-like flavin-dependent oxidoreductase (luciferase family)
MEASTLLAGLAASTSRIPLGALVTGITYPHPAILATEAITVDQISRGRLELGLGAAWQPPEHEELGIPSPPIKYRAERLNIDRRQARAVERAIDQQARGTCDVTKERYKLRCAFRIARMVHPFIDRDLHGRLHR